MEFGCGALVPQAIQAPHRIGSRLAAYAAALDLAFARSNAKQKEGLKPDLAWGQRRSDVRLTSFLYMGSCPKCGRKKVRRKSGRKWCPHCGNFPTPTKESNNEHQ